MKSIRTSFGRRSISVELGRRYGSRPHIAVVPFLCSPAAKLNAPAANFTPAGSDPPDEDGDTLSSHGVSHDVTWTSIGREAPLLPKCKVCGYRPRPRSHYVSTSGRRSHAIQYG